MSHQQGSHPRHVRRPFLAAVAGTGAIMLTAAGLVWGGAAATAGTTAAGSRCLDAVAAGSPALLEQRTFAAAAQTYGVPEAVLEGVSYLESRWDDHGASPSVDGGYGPMHITDLHELVAAARGTGSSVRSAGPPSFHTVEPASSLTGLTPTAIKTQLGANICAGAALLASYQKAAGHATGATAPAADWIAAVSRYGGGDRADASTFVAEVFKVIRAGAARTTNTGQQVALPAHPSLAVPKVAASVTSSTTNPNIDCPPSLDCQWVPAPYEQYGPEPWEYGNHDLANRPTDLKINYIVIHDSEGTYAEDMKLVQDPEYLAWNYTVRSSDGHVAQHLNPKDIGWHAGNWYVNMHSIGIEHEGFAATGATWYTEAMYESSARLVRYLAHQYGIPLDRAHIIGHDQVPGITPAYVQGMHWDPGPFWNWQHYFNLLGAPLSAGTTTQPIRAGDVVTVLPGFTVNEQPVTGCDGASTDPCPTQGTNFVYLHTAPSASSPLVPDIGLHPDGSPSTTFLSDWGPRADAGQKLVVAQVSGSWVGVWFEGELGWIYAPAGHSPLRVSSGTVVTAAPGTSAPVYGRAYPEPAAYAQYGGNIAVQDVVPLQYSIGAGQAYVLADAHVPTDYYYATLFDCQGPDQCTDVVGHDVYYEIWFGHRVAYVRAADVVLH